MTEPLFSNRFDFLENPKGGDLAKHPPIERIVNENHALS